MSRADLGYRRIAVAALIAAGASFGGCIDSFTPVSAYADQRFLCAPEMAGAYADEESACRDIAAAGGVCGGVLSMRGQLQGESLTVESRLRGAEFYSALLRTAAVEYLDRVDLVGQSPYFLFAFKIYSIGGPVGSVTAVDRALDWDVRSPYESSDPATYEDAAIRGNLRIENGKENVELSAVDGSGDVHVEAQGTTELRGTFTASFDDPVDKIEGCFVGIATQTHRSLR